MRRRSSPCRIRSANSSESGSGPRSAERAVVTRGEDPPRGLALGAVLAHEERRAVDDADAHHRTRGFVRLGGSSTSSRPACERWTRSRARRHRRPPTTRYLPRRVTAVDRRPEQRLGRDDGLQRRERVGVEPGEPCAARGRRAARRGPASAAARARPILAPTVRPGSGVGQGRIVRLGVPRNRVRRGRGTHLGGRTRRSPRGAPRSPRGSGPGPGRAARSRCPRGIRSTLIAPTITTNRVSTNT